MLAVSVVSGCVFVFFSFGMCVCAVHSTHVQAHHSHLELMEVLENEVNTLFLPSYSASYCSASFLYLLCLLLSDHFSPVLYYYYYFFFFSCFPSFHESQSLDQVALTNATVLDGSGGGPNGSLAGSVGSVAVCLPSESSLTDSLHTSAVSLPRVAAGSTGGNACTNQLCKSDDEM